MSYPHSLAPSNIDFIQSDFDALASHMQQCETAHGRWPMARSHLQHARAIAAGRIVTPSPAWRSSSVSDSPLLPDR